MALEGFVNTLGRFVLVLVLFTAATLSAVFVVDQFIASTIGLTALLTQTIKTIIVIVFGSIIILFIRRSKHVISKHVGAHLAMVFQFFMILIASILVMFGLLQVFQVSPTNLLIGGGIVSIVLGIIVSTFVGNILAGTLVLMTHSFKVGDLVTVNGIPGRIEEIAAMSTRIKNDIGGQMVVPNSAIVSGAVIVTTFAVKGDSSLNRLPYSSGDRVFTTYMNEEGVVSELTPFHTKILLDSGKEVTFLNSSVLTGSVAVAKISGKV